MIPTFGDEVNALQTPPSEDREPTLEELMKRPIPTVYSASKYIQKVSEAPASVTIVTSEEVKRYGYRTLAEILQSVRGFHVSYDRNYSFLGIRGVQRGDFNSRVLLLVNGHRVNDSIKDAAFIGTEFILDVDLIDRVEVIRGPGSSLYGNNAFFGVINVITRQGREFPGMGAEVSGEYGEFDTWKGRVTYGHRFTNSVELLLSGTLYDSEGPDRLFYKEFSAVNQGIAQGRDTTSFENFFGSLGYNGLTLEGAYFSRDKGDPTAQFGTDFNDPRTRTIYDRSYVTLNYAHPFTNLVDVNARVYYDRNDFDISLPGGGRLFKEKDTGEWWGGEAQLSKLFFKRHKLTIGGEYRDDFHQERHSFFAEPHQEITNVFRSRESHAVYVEGDLAILTNLHLNAGARYDKYTDFSPSYNPRLALIYNPWEQSAFKAIYSTAFRAPNFFELSDPRFQNIEPEKITAYELAYEQGIGPYLHTTVSGFYNELHNLITFENGNFRNTDAEAKGVEFELEGQTQWGLLGRASYTLQETRDRFSDQRLTDSPEHLFKFNLSVPVVKEKIFASVEFQYLSERKSTRSAISSSGQVITEAGQDAAGFGIVNFTLFSRDLIKGLQLSAGIYNLLDRRYSDPSTPQHFQDLLARDGRTFRVKLTYQF